MTLLLFLLCFGVHNYRIAVKFDSGTTPQKTKVFFSKGGFSEVYSRNLPGNKKKFNITAPFQLRKIRIDIDNPDRTYFDLKYLRINNKCYRGTELYEMLQHTNFIQVEPIGDICRLHLAASVASSSRIDQPLPDLDYYVSFRIGIIDRTLDCFGFVFFLQLLVFLCLTSAVWMFEFDMTGYALPKIKYAANKIWQITPEILLLAMLGSFLLLRPCLHNYPTSERLFFMFRSDVEVAFVLIGCAAACYIIRNTIVRLMIFAILMVLYIFIFADCFLLYQFNTRISVIESTQWAKNLKWTLPIVWRSFRTHFAYVEYLIIGSTVALWIVSRYRTKKQNWRFVIFCLILALAGIIFRMAPSPHNIFETKHYNVFAYGFSQKMYIPYSRKFLDKVKPFELKYQENDGKALNRNCILLVVESLSSFQSKYFSGMDIDNMPNFDKEMLKASSLSRKHVSSSYNTAANTFAFLSGFSPLHAPKVHFDYDNPKYYQNPLPLQFKKHGYKTVFMKPAKQVDFVDVLLKHTKFDCVLDDTDPYYDNAPRYVFNSVPDKFMLDRLVKYVQEAPAGEKYFIYAQTVSMHAPYFDPRSGQYSYEETVRTFDLMFPDFMGKLRNTGFFDNGGVLVLTGDHRAMVTIGSAESKKMGFFTSQYVPLVIFGDIPVKLDDTQHYNHVDLNYSLQYLMLDKAVRHQYQRNIFTADRPEKFYCAFYQQRTNPSLVLLQTDSKVGKIHLNGDNTKITLPDMTEEEREKINSYLVWLRTK